MAGLQPQLAALVLILEQVIHLLGEGADDLAPFVPEAFVDAIVG